MNMQGTTAGHNVGVRREIILDVFRKVTALEAERKTITDEISNIKQTRIKGDLGMKIADFNAAMRLHKLEGDDRDQMLTTLQETFDALGVGEQLDFVAAMERTATPPSDGTDEPAPPDNVTRMSGAGTMPEVGASATANGGEPEVA